MLFRVRGKGRVPKCRQHFVFYHIIITLANVDKWEEGGAGLKNLFHKMWIKVMFLFNPSLSLIVGVKCYEALNTILSICPSPLIPKWSGMKTFNQQCFFLNSLNNN